MPPIVADADSVARGEVPEVPAEFKGRTGYGPLEGPITGMFGEEVEAVEDFPPGTPALVKGAWYNWSLNDETPSFVSRDVNENRRMWQSIEMERMLDHHPPHEVHPNELPDYHFWPAIQNEIHPTPRAINGANHEHFQDQTHLPRFHKTGVPKTPPQMQDFFVPLNKKGLFDWRQNVKQNGYTASMFDKIGWERRYHLAINRPMVPGPLFITGMRTWANMPINFRHFEIPQNIRWFRSMSGSTMDKHAIIAGFYLAGLAYMAGNDARYRRLNWGNEPWNYDLEFTKYARDKGGFHSVV